MEQAAPTAEYPDATAIASPAAAAATAAAAAATTAADAGASADGGEGGRADYAWVLREPAPAAHMNMLECLLGVLEEGLVMPRATSTAAVSVAGAGRARGAGGTGSGKSQSQPQSSGEKYVRCTR